MTSFEQGFGDTEMAAQEAGKANRELDKHLRAIVRSAKVGNIASMRRDRQNAIEALDTLTSSVRRVVESWPFDSAAEENYLEDGFAGELIRESKGSGLDIFMSEHKEQLISSPSIIEILPRERAIRIDRKKVSDIRPSSLTRYLKKNQEKSGGRFPPMRFIESLYKAYSSIVKEGAAGLMPQTGSARVIPLSKIYDMFTLLPNSNRGYTRIDFARDLYILDEKGPRCTRRGAEVDFPSSTGTRRRSSDLFSFVGPNGELIEYYGIRFSEGD